MRAEIAVAYSGGTDSTCAAAVVCERFDAVHLLTYHRLGLFSSVNSRKNAEKLQNKFGNDKVTHRIIKLSRLYDYASDERYFHYISKYGFFNLSGCGICKLAIHIRTLIWCLENNIKNACDGSTRDLYLFPTQIEKINNEVKKMYAHFDLSYETPVYNFDLPDTVDLWDKMGISEKLRIQTTKEPKKQEKKNTTGRRLYELGLMPAENVKGTALDQHMQSRCFQFILFNIYLLWAYFPWHTYEEFEKKLVSLYREKIEHFVTLIEEYIKKKEKSRLYGLIEY